MPGPVWFQTRSFHRVSCSKLGGSSDHTDRLDSYRVSINIYMDLSEAFDTLKHSIILQKLILWHTCNRKFN